MKRKMVLVFALLLMVVLNFPVGASHDGVLIRVQATGDVRVTPDVANIWLGVQTEASTAFKPSGKTMLSFKVY